MYESSKVLCGDEVFGNSAARQKNQAEGVRF